MPTVTTTYLIGNGNNGAGANQIVSETTGGVTTEYEYDANGNRASRTIPFLATTGDTASSSITLSGLASTTGVNVGMEVSGTGILSGTTVASIVSSTSVTLSTAATATNSGILITFSNVDVYSYDDENRLIDLDYETGGSGTGTYAYQYDYRTRRVTRTEPGPVTTNIVFDGGVSIEEYNGAGPGSPTVEYVRGHDYGGGVGGLEYSVRSGTPSFNFYDSRGDVTTQTDGSGSVTFQTGYEAFGDQTVTSGSTSDRQKASTKEQDPTGLLNEGFRYRDPVTGTFLTRDPLGFLAGPNMYTYVHQNPWTKFDPEGLADPPNPPILPPTPKDAKQTDSKQSTPNPPPTAKLEVPKLSFNMQSHDQQVAQAAADFNRASASPTTSAKTAQQQNAVPLKDDKGNVVKAADGTPALVPSNFDTKKVISAGQTDQALGWVSEPARALATAVDLDKFNRGNSWDLQRLSGNFDPRFVDSATILIGMYAASAGIPQRAILSIENIRAKNSKYTKDTPMDPTYTHLPVRNVTNTITGMKLVQSGAISAP